MIPTAPTRPRRPVLRTLLILLAAAGLSPLAPAAAIKPPDAVTPALNLPAPTRLNYRISANQFPYRLSGELLWQVTGSRYQARMRFGAFGLSRVQLSRGHVGPGGLVPEQFTDSARANAVAHFDTAQSRVSFGAQTPSLALLPGAQDRLSVLVQLGALVAANPAQFSPGATLAIQTIGVQSAETWRFAVEQTESLALPNGTQSALKLLRQPRESGDQRVEVWLAPFLGYLPARVRITEPNGDYVDQVWQASEAAPALN